MGHRLLKKMSVAHPSASVPNAAKHGWHRLNANWLKCMCEPFTRMLRIRCSDLHPRLRLEGHPCDGFVTGTARGCDLSECCNEVILYLLVLRYIFNLNCRNIDIQITFSSDLEIVSRNTGTCFCKSIF